MTTWNNRVIEYIVSDNEKCFGIHEVIYNDDGTISFWTTEAIGVVSETVDGLLETLDRMKEACEKPALLERDMPGSRAGI